MKDFHDMSACPEAFLPKDPSNGQDVRKVLVEAERGAIRGYNAICSMTFGKDHRT
jgi:ferritin-like protein